jgi:hypothetical protein
MTEQPTERRAEQPRPVLGITHKRHGCGTTHTLCNMTAADVLTPQQGTFTIIAPAQLTQYQDCVVCESLWSEAFVLELKCGHCGQRIKQ